MTTYLIYFEINGKNTTETLFSKSEALSKAEALQANNESVMVQECKRGSYPWTIFQFHKQN